VLSRSARGGTYLVVGEPGALTFVLQELLPDQAPTADVMAAFQGEGQQLLQLKYPRAPKFLDIFHESVGADTRFYRVQQQVIGESLESRAVDESRLRDVASHVLEFLKVLHRPELHLIHGDIKASSLVLDKEGLLWIVGWGRTVLGPAARTSDDVSAVGATLAHLLSRPDGTAAGGSPSFEEGSPELLRFIAALSGEPADRRVRDASRAIRLLQNAQEKRLSRNPPFWIGAAVTIGLLGLSALYIFLRYRR
jgi:serine/threonine protein kinase